MFKELQHREIRGLSIKQPFAELMLLGKVETRTFKTKYRGLVLICASAKRYDESFVRYRCGGELSLEIETIIAPPNEVLNGHAIAIGELVDCRPLQEEDLHFIRWHDGWASMYGWHFENVIPIQPFPHKGQQGMPRLPLSVKQLIRQREL